MAEERKRTERLMGEVAQRRNRNPEDFDFTGSNHLAIPDEIKAQLSAEGWRPRWVNDERGRIERLTTKDDYQKVPGVDPVRVDTNKDGEPVFAHLLAKPETFFQEDQRARDARRVQVEQAMVKGKVPSIAKTADGVAVGDPAPVQGQLGAEIYVPDGNAIQRDKRVLE